MDDILIDSQTKECEVETYFENNEYPKIQT